MPKQTDHGDGSKSENTAAMSDAELDKVTGGGGVRVLKEVVPERPRPTMGVPGRSRPGPDGRPIID